MFVVDKIKVPSMPELTQDMFFRYDNPFEQKWALKHEYLSMQVFSTLASYIDMAEDTFGIKLEYDPNNHFSGLFQYDIGDYLGLHLDAELHPLNKKRKHVTALMYLTYGRQLELWTDPDTLFQCVVPEPGLVVLFDNYWHRVPVQITDSRVVATVSFMSNWSQGLTRERAYFAPCTGVGEVWTPETYALRDLRCDALKYAEAYRS